MSRISITLPGIRAALKLAALAGTDAVIPDDATSKSLRAIGIAFIRNPRITPTGRIIAAPIAKGHPA